MFTNRLFYLLILVVLLTLTACAPQVTSDPVATLVPNQPITLRLAVADAEGRPSDPYVREFIEQVNTLSNGSITIQPIWDAAADTTPSFEPGVIKALKDGQYDLGLAGARAFDMQGITSFQALQAPFLITNDGLSKAVATSEIATRMLDSISSSGVVGLTLWPEDLRHPFSTTPNKPILAPEDFVGLNIRAVPSDVTYTLIETLGATPMLGDSGYQGSESGLSQVVFLTRTPTATGNVVFFPKFQVLFAHGGTFETLTESQRTILQNAALATQQKAIAEHPGEAVTASAWCEDGGSIVMASDEQIAAFEAAAQPVFARIEQDPFNAEMITAIRDLKAKTQPSAGAGACAPNTEPWSEGLLPNGTWTVELSVEDLAGMGVSQSEAPAWAGVGIFTFQDGKAVYRHQGETNYECEATYEVVEDFVRITYGDSPSNADFCIGIVEDVQWRLDEDGLHFQLIAAQNVPFLEDKAAWEAKPWQKVADQ
jgi:TRAP-type C4-dicarboxylate transport system substrate-binding protein